ncbi:FUSC family protein [soil metagenome]
MYLAANAHNGDMSRAFIRWAHRPSWPDADEAARSLLGVLLAVAVALEFATPVAAIAAGASAAITGAVAVKNDGSALSTLGIAALMGVAASVGTLAAAHSPVFVVVIALWSLGAGMLWAVSGDAGLVAAAATALLVSCSPHAASVPDAAIAGLLAVFGGLTQVLLVAVWPRPRRQAQHDALTAAYRSVSAGARELAADPAATLDVSALIDLHDAYPAAARGRYALPERIVMTLLVLRSDSSGSATSETLTAAAEVVHTLDKNGTRARAEHALADLARAADRLPARDLAYAQRLQTQLGEAIAARFTDAALSSRRIRQVWELLSAQLSWDSPIARHAVRLAAATTLGTAIAVGTGIEQGYWLALTVLLVLRPETAHTYTRCVIRVLGNTAGVALATAITVVWHPSGFTAVVLAAVFLAVAYAVAGIGYVPVTAAVATALVFLLDIGGTSGSDMLSERLVATAVGGGLAIASHVLLPDRSLVRLHQRAGELLKDEIDYAATVIRAFVHPLTDTEQTISAAWERAVRARSAFEAASGSARADAPSVRRWLRTYRAGLNAVTGSCGVLETQLAAARPATLDRRFVVAVDDYVDALRGETPRAGQAWTVDVTQLATAEQQLRDAAELLGKADTAQRVLIAEVEAITGQLLAVAAAAP